VHWHFTPDESKNTTDEKIATIKDERVNTADDPYMSDKRFDELWSSSP